MTLTPAVATGKRDPTANETDEATATDWIALQLKALGITPTPSPEQEKAR